MIRDKTHGPNVPVTVEEKSWAIYARSAVENPAEIAKQLAKCHDLGVTEFKDEPFVFFDDGKSGMCGNRADFQSLMRLIAAGSFKAVVVSNVMRISRSLYFLVQVIRHFDKYEADLLTISDQGLLTKVDLHSILTTNNKKRQRSSRKIATPA